VVNLAFGFDQRPVTSDLPDEQGELGEHGEQAKKRDIHHLSL
jgi:hypothetical protein